MGHSQAEKAETHDRIVRIAAQRFREAGLNGLSVADLMKEAGLTVGGFYRHFRSRDELVLEAVGAALQQGATRLADGAGSGGQRDFSVLLDAYLSEAHRDAIGTGCALAALAGDAARSGKQTRTLFTRQIRRTLQTIGDALGTPDEEMRRKESIVAFSAIFGALGLARATSDHGLSREIMTAVKAFLREQFGSRNARPPAGDF